MDQDIEIIAIKQVVRELQNEELHPAEGFDPLSAQIESHNNLHFDLLVDGPNLGEVQFIQLPGVFVIAHQELQIGQIEVHPLVGLRVALQLR